VHAHRSPRREIAFAAAIADTEAPVEGRGSAYGVLGVALEHRLQWSTALAKRHATTCRTDRDGRERLP
jgi:hypothetical protein